MQLVVSSVAILQTAYVENTEYFLENVLSYVILSAYWGNVLHQRRGYE